MGGWNCMGRYVSCCLFQTLFVRQGAWSKGEREEMMMMTTN